MPLVLAARVDRLDVVHQSLAAQQGRATRPLFSSTWAAVGYFTDSLSHCLTVSQSH